MNHELEPHIITARAFADAFASESGVCRYKQAAEIAAMASIACNKAAAIMEDAASRPKIAIDPATIDETGTAGGWMKNRSQSRDATQPPSPASTNQRPGE